MRELRLDLGAYAPLETTDGVGAWRYERALPLTTDGHLRVIALGVGAAFSRRMRQSNFILVKGETALFVDLGTDASRRLAELGHSCHSVRDLVVTHSHADHIGSLEELALKRRYEAPLRMLPRDDGESEGAYAERLADARRSGRFRPNLYVPEFYARELWEMSLRGGLAFSEEVEHRGPEGGMVLDHFFKVIVPEDRHDDVIPSWRIEVGGIEVLSFVTKHVPDSHGSGARRMYSIGLVVDGRIYISGDTQFDPVPLERFGGGCEALWHDAQSFPGGVHAHYDQLKSLPTETRARMWLYHLTDGMLEIDARADGFAGFVNPAPVVYDFE